MSFIEENGIKALCFDIDGTLYEKRKMDIRLFVSALKDPIFAIGYSKMRNRVREIDGYEYREPLDEDEIKKRNAEIMYGDSSKESVERFTEKEERLRLSWDRSYRTIRAAEGVREALSSLQARGLRLGAFSDFPIGVKLKAMGLEDFFEFAISSEDTGHYKPSLTPFCLIEKAFGIDRSHILYVGDSYKKDAVGSKMSHMKSCLIFQRPKKEYNMADIVVRDWKEFARLVL